MAAPVPGIPGITTATGNAEEAGDIQLNAPSQVYYRHHRPG